MKRVKPSTESEEYTFKAKVWVYTGPAAWHFVTLPKKLAAEIKTFHGGLSKSFGTIAVLATVGGTSWKTSVFSDTKSGSYILPLKAEIRKKEGIQANRMTQITLRI